jgi:hypothetical protein
MSPFWTEGDRSASRDLTLSSRGFIADEGKIEHRTQLADGFPAGDSVPTLYPYLAKFGVPDNESLCEAAHNGRGSIPVGNPFRQSEGAIYSTSPDSTATTTLPQGA